MSEIIIFSKNPEAYFNRRLAEEAEKSGPGSIKIINPLNCLIFQDKVIYKGSEIKAESIIFLRTPPFREEKDYFHMAARILQGKGSRVINSPDSVDISGNKFYTARALRESGLPVLPSAAVRNTADLDRAVELVGGYPVFLKTMNGTRGIGVIFCPCRETLYGAAEAMWAYFANLMVEKYARACRGETLRVLVFQGRVLGAVKNRAGNDGGGEDEFLPGFSEAGFVNEKTLLRSNFSRGGSVTPGELSEDLSRLALSACDICGITFGGVDLIRDDEGWRVLEINSAPGIRGFEEATRKNIAGEILQILTNSAPR